MSRDSIKVTDSLKFTTPKGKVVYGGGGIIPDVFVAVDTTAYLENGYFPKMNSFAFNYSDNHRSALIAQGFENYDSDVKQQEIILNLFLEEVSLERTVSKKKKEILSHYLKALIARQVFDETAFSIIHDRRDPMLLKVLELDSIQ